MNRFILASGGKNSIIGIVSSSSQDDKDSYAFYKQAAL
jgi:hypothetical protein